MRRGFSLIEVIIATGILGGISIILSQSFFAISRANTKAELVKDMKQSGDFSVRIMEQMIRSNTGISSSCTGNPDPNKQLIITNPDGYQTTFGCITQTINGITVTRLASSSGALISYLTPTNVTLGGSDCSTSTLQFICTQYPSQPNSILVSFTLSQASVATNNFEAARVPFQTTINARN